MAIASLAAFVDGKHTGAPVAYRCPAAWLLLCVIVLGACAAAPSQHVYKLYPGPVRPDSELATIGLGDGVFSLQIDGLTVNRADFGHVNILPGPHRIKLDTWYLVSVLVDPSGLKSDETGSYVDLEPGHRYLVRSSDPGGGMRYLWIEDADSGQLVAGARRP